MEQTISAKYLQYGVSNEIAVDLEKRNLTVTIFRSIPKEDLINKYGLNANQIEFIKNCIQRKPIPEEIIYSLLENSNFLCCLCKGNKSHAFIIHHIVEYSKTQDNSYENLAVLCPNDHDLAHREGISLTNRITVNQIKNAKKNWEKQVESNNAQRARQGKSEIKKYNPSNVSFRSVKISDNSKETIVVNHPLTTHTKLLLKVTQSKQQQEFVIYLSIITNENDQKWIGFGTPLAINNVYPSERVYRIGKPGEFNYEIVEHILERIRESGLAFKGNPIRIDKVRLWGWHNNKDVLQFDFTLLD